MRICVFGAGAIGGHLAARLAKAGADVSVVARGDNLQAIRKHGLRVHTPHDRLHERVRASDDAGAFGEQDAVVVTLKAHSLPAAARDIAKLLGPETPVAFVANGIPWWYFHRQGGALDGARLPRLDPGGGIWEAIGPERAIGGVVYSASEVHEPGVVTVDTPMSRLILGEPDGTVSERARRLAELFVAGGIATTVTPAIRDEIWSKLMNNLASGSLTILAGAATMQVYADPACRSAVRVMFEEANAIAAALGSKLEPDYDQKIAHGRTMNHKPSILQDLERGRPMEVEALFDTPLLLGRAAGVPTPMLDLFVGLVKIRAAGAGLWEDSPTPAVNLVFPSAEAVPGRIGRAV
jgi:2-dehydropantoate 2-reductase